MTARWCLPAAVFFALLMIFVGRGGALAQPYGLEIDLDGTVGNGPDTIDVALGDSVNAGIWVTGEGIGLFQAQASVCNPDTSLSYLSWAQGPFWWSSWILTFTPPCLTIFGSGLFIDEAVSVPFLFAAVTYRAAVDESLGALVLDLSSSYWLNTGYVTGPFASGVPGFVRIGATAAAETSWGSIKSLFR